MLGRVLIANRGEIASRIARTCRRLAVPYVTVHSEADVDAPYGRGAIANVSIGSAQASASYLRGDRIIAAALDTGCKAIHPGYGFLAENADFARAVVDAGLIFVGPDADVIARMGDKAAAKRLMAAAGVPVLPGAVDPADSPAAVRALIAETGLPVILKPIAGGGGKGMSVVTDEREATAAAEAAMRIAHANFGDGRLLVERYLAAPRHIEVQVFGDRRGAVVHLFERDCSLQRRHQKVVEEAPAPGLAAQLRQAMFDAAVRGARAIGYVNAGTFEFIVDSDSSFYFLEVNTRLQVEHPVTEAVTGLDLVEWQLRVAAGEPLPLAQEEIVCRGHAIEARVYAEDPRAGFRPCPGHALGIVWPSGLRVDAALIDGGDVSPFYDPMVAKLVAHASDRSSALLALRDGIERTRIAGLTTNLGFLARLLAHPDAAAGPVDTHFIDRHLATLSGGDVAPAAAAAAAGIACSTTARAAKSSPWGGRIGGFDRRYLDPEAPLGRQTFVHRDAPIEVRLRAGKGGAPALVVGEHAYDVTAEFDGKWWHGAVDGAAWCALAAPDRLELMVGGDRVALTRASAAAQAASDTGDAAVAPMPGVVVVVSVGVGDRVAKGAVVAIVEAMKMENQVLAPFAGVVREVRCRKQESVIANQVLVVIGRDVAVEVG
jgi:propionyl-CoA carboxylase alpha chain/3-methylcrotonyl-CoA carboxylase alpha subunit